jgi:hypothetical protein
MTGGAQPWNANVATVTDALSGTHDPAKKMVRINGGLEPLIAMPLKRMGAPRVSHESRRGFSQTRSGL